MVYLKLFILYIRDEIRYRKEIDEFNVEEIYI